MLASSHSRRLQSTRTSPGRSFSIAAWMRAISANPCSSVEILGALIRTSRLTSTRSITGGRFIAITFYRTRPLPSPRYPARMLPWTLLDSAEVPGDGGTMRLHQRGDEFSIRVDNYELMNSRVHGSEDALATLALARLPDRSAIRVLIGGLGMGFTLLAVL